MFSRVIARCVLIMLVGLLLIAPGGATPMRAQTETPDQQPAPYQQPTSISYWGMNLYMAKGDRVRTGDNVPLLIDMAKQAGVQWTREEFAWDVVEPSNNRFVPVYDEHMIRAAESGLGVIGMLLTTPKWARDPSCRPTREEYWCPPTDPQEYAEFAAWMVERFDGDGYKDVPGSPRVAAWELWNEPNDLGNWSEVGEDGVGRLQRYGEMMVAAYRAIKEADPTAIVLVGGVYIFDGGCGNDICDGVNFLNGVFAHVPEARTSFDVLSIHPYASPTAPDAVGLPRIVLIEGTSRMTRDWLDSPEINRPEVPVWISELGWCTGDGNCPGDIIVSEEQQANYMVRALVIAQQNGVQHANWFQLEDSFNDSERYWGNGAILHNYDGWSYPQKPAYAAYRTLTYQIGDGVPVGPGPLHTHVFDSTQPMTNSGGTYDYRYLRGETIIDVLWRPNDEIAVAFPVEPGRAIAVVDRDGVETPVVPQGGQIPLTLSERPLMVVQRTPAETP